ncbi:PD-(D/E)XK nuclease family protein [bacterium]|nr:PD-(D/E)XK nuclease family protein [bacterium]
MRNIFDQYSQPENRLTHALVSTFGEDARLLRKFVKWITEATPPTRLKIVEQQLPGEYELTELDYERTGLPDAWIHDDGDWSLLIESKVAAPLRLDQLKRHYRTAQKRGFENVTVLAIGVTAPTRKLPDYVVFRTWRDIYSWLSRQSEKSEWAVRALRYMEVAERKWPADGYLTEGTLTEFSGVHFDEKNPYSYPEGKRLIRLMLSDLRDRSDLRQIANLKAPGRGKITGSGVTHVWDYLRLRGLDISEKHTSQPHLSLLITDEKIRAFLDSPNSMKPRFRNPVKQLGEDEFFELMAQLNANFRPITKAFSGSRPFANMSQRRFASVGAKPTLDGSMDFDLRTAFHDTEGQKVKVQPQWLRAMYSMIINKHSNMEWAVGMSFPFESCKKTRQTAILDAIAESWIACKPVLDVMLKN